MVFRLLGALISVLFAIAVAVITWPQFFRLEHTFPIAQLVALRGVVIASLLLIALVFLLLAIAKPLRAFSFAMAVIAVLVIVVFIGALVGLEFGLNDGKVHHGIKVQGVEIGGMD